MILISIRWFLKWVKLTKTGTACSLFQFCCLKNRSRPWQILIQNFKANAQTAPEKLTTLTD